MANPTIKIDITSSLDNKGTNELKNELKVLREEMDRLRASGHSQSDAFNLVKNRAGEVVSALKGVSRENRGLDADTKQSSRSLLALGRDITIVIAGLKQFGAALRSALNEGAEFGVLKDNFIALEGGIEQATEKLKLLRNASTGNLDDKELIQYSNKMKLLGVTTDDTAKFLDIIEVQSDKVKIGFEQGEKVLQKYLITGRDKSLMELGINVADINNKIKEQTGLTTKQVKLLDDETQQRIRLNAILSLNIGTTGNLNDKTKDNADKIKSVESALKNVTLNYQYTIANGIVKYSEALGISNTVMESVIGKVGFLGKSLVDLAPILATLKIAFPAAFSAVLPIIAAVSLQIGGLILLVKSFKDSIPDMIRAFQFAKDVISGENISDSFQKGVDDYNKQHQKTSEELGIDEGNKYVKGIVDKFQEQKKQAEEKIKLQNDIEKQLNNLDKKNKSVSSSSKESSKQLDEVAQKQEELNKVTEKYNDAVGKNYLGLAQKLRNEMRNLNAEIKDLIEGEKNLAIQYAKNERAQIGRENKREPINKERAQGAIEDINRLPIVFQTSLGLATQLSSILGLGAHTFAFQLIDGLNQAISLGRTLFSALETILNIGSGGIFGAIFGGGGASKAFAMGGYTGSGGKYEPAGIVHKGEVVFDQPAVNALGVNFLENLRIRAGGSTNNSNLRWNANSYANSGIVKPFTQDFTPEINVRANIPGVKWIIETNKQAKKFKNIKTVK